MEEKITLPYEKAIEEMAREYKKVVAKPVQAFPYLGETKVIYTCKKFLSNTKLDETAIKPLFNLWNYYYEISLYSKHIFERTNNPNVREIVMFTAKSINKTLERLKKLYHHLTSKSPVSSIKINSKTNYGDVIRKMLLLYNRAENAYLEYTETVRGMRTALAVLPRYTSLLGFAMLTLLAF
jgi:hypothetical protein